MRQRFSPSSQLQAGHPGLEQRAVVELVGVADALRVLEDLGDVGVLFLGDVLQLFQQRQVAVALDVALRARIAVPVPGAAEVAARLDDAEVVEARFAQASAGQQARETAADDRDLDLLAQRRRG